MSLHRNVPCLGCPRKYYQNGGKPFTELILHSCRLGGLSIRVPYPSRCVGCVTCLFCAMAWFVCWFVSLMLAICLPSRTSRMCEEEPFSQGDLSAKGLAEDIQVSFDEKSIPRIALHCFGREPLRIL